MFVVERARIGVQRALQYAVQRQGRVPVTAAEYGADRHLRLSWLNPKRTLSAAWRYDSRPRGFTPCIY